MIPYDGRTAAVRYNNPGAQYPSERAKRFGMTGFGLIGGGHKIAHFPSEAHGAAANMDNFSRSYRGLTLADAVRKWRGGNGSLAVPAGFDPSMRVDDSFLGDRDRMTRFFGGMSQHEGRGAAGPVKPDTWGQGFDWYRAGGAPAGAAIPASTGGQTMQQPLGMLRPAIKPAAPAAAPAGDPNALGAISPEHMKTLASMGLLGSRNRQAPRNVGEALSQLGDKIYDTATRSHVLGELRKGTAAENAAWSAYGGASASPAPGVAPEAQTAAPAAPAAPGGMITAGRSFGTNPSPTQALDTNRPMIAGGMVAPGAGFDGPQVRSEAMAPPPVPTGMIGGGERLAATPAGAPADPRASWLDAQEARAQRGLAHPATRDSALRELEQIRGQRYKLMDPMADLQRRGVELDIATKQRELDAPKTQVKTVKEDERVMSYDPRTGRTEWITPPEGAGGGGQKHFREAMGKKQAEIIQGYIEDGDKSTTANADLERMRELSQVVGTGAWEGWKPTIGPWAESLGVSVRGLGEAQAFQAIANKLAPNMRPSGSGSTSDKDMSIFMASLPQLSNTPEGRLQILDQFQALHDYRVQRAAIANDVANGLVSRQEGTERIKALPDPFAQFKAREAARRKDAVPTVPQAPSTKSAPAVATPSPASVGSGPPAAAIGYLKANSRDPAIVQQFETKYGAGAAKRYLQQDERRKRWSQRGSAYGF